MCIMSELISGRSNRMILCFVGVMLMFFILGTSTVHALDISWVSQDANDVSFITALTNAGHNVSWKDSRYETLNDDKVTELNAADLVIVARNTSSSNYAG